MRVKKISMLKQNVTQGTDEWHEARQGLITGSRISAVMGASRFQSRKALLKEMAAEMIDKRHRPRHTNHHMERGLRWESTGIWLATQSLGIDSLDVETGKFYANPKYGYSPDGTTKDALFEVKVPQKGNPDESAPIDPGYICQMQWGMNLLRKNHCWYVEAEEYKSEKGKRALRMCRKVRLERDEDWFATAIEAADRFLEELAALVEQGLSEVVVVDTPEAIMAATLYVRDNKKSKSAKAALDAAREQVMKIADGREVTMGVLSLVRKSRAGNLDAKRMAADGIDVEKYRGKPTEFLSILVRDK